MLITATEDTSDRESSIEFLNSIRAIAWHIIQQNEGIQNGTITGIEIPLATLGIGNGLYSPLSFAVPDNSIDQTIQTEYYVAFAVNNTYDMSYPFEKRC